MISKNINIYLCYIFVISIILIFNSTSPFNFSTGVVRWYHNLTLSIFVYILNKETFRWDFLGKFRNIYYLIFIISFFNIFFNPYGINVSIGLIVTNISFLLLVPFMATVNFRKSLYFTFFYIGLNKVLMIFNYMMGGEALFREMSGKGKDKNALAMLISVAIIMILSKIVFNNLKKVHQNDRFKNIVKILITLVMFTSVIASGSKSGLLSLFISILFLFYVNAKFINKKLILKLCP